MESIHRPCPVVPRPFQWINGESMSLFGRRSSGKGLHAADAVLHSLRAAKHGASTCRTDVGHNDVTAPDILAPSVLFLGHGLPVSKYGETPPGPKQRSRSCAFTLITQQRTHELHSLLLLLFCCRYRCIGCALDHVRCCWCSFAEEFRRRMQSRVARSNGFSVDE